MSTEDQPPDAPTILVVEDEGDFRAVIQIHLARSGFRVVEARDAGAAWEILQREQVQGVVLDVRLPGIDGNSLARQLRRSAVRIPIVAFTAWPEDERALGNPPFDALHVKPEIAPVIASLQRLLATPPPAAA